MDQPHGLELLISRPSDPSPSSPDLQFCFFFFLPFHTTKCTHFFPSLPIFPFPLERVRCIGGEIKMEQWTEEGVCKHALPLQHCSIPPFHGVFCVGGFPCSLIRKVQNHHIKTRKIMKELGSLSLVWARFFLSFFLYHSSNSKNNLKKKSYSHQKRDGCSAGFFLLLFLALCRCPVR